MHNCRLTGNLPILNNQFPPETLTQPKSRPSLYIYAQTLSLARTTQDAQERRSAQGKAQHLIVHGSREADFL